MNALVTRGLTKCYGRIVALRDLDLEVPRGAACGLVGPNGSGKTTLFGAIAGLLVPDGGSVDVLGRGRFDPARDAGRVSLMPQDSSPSPHATLRQSLRYYGELQGMDPARARREADHWLERVRLTERAGARHGQLSHGMRRRFSIAQALLGEPELILLDEPTSGLDPELAAEMRELFSELRGKSTLLISSHVLSELEELCDYVVFIEAGRRVRQGPMDSVREADTLIRVRLTAPPLIGELSRHLEGATLDWSPPVLSVRLKGKDPPEVANARILRALLEQGAGILSLEPGQSLEASYLAAREQGTRARP